MPLGARSRCAHAHQARTASPPPPRGSCGTAAAAGSATSTSTARRAIMQREAVTAACTRCTTCLGEAMKTQQQRSGAALHVMEAAVVRLHKPVRAEARVVHDRRSCRRKCAHAWHPKRHEEGEKQYFRVHSTLVNADSRSVRTRVASNPAAPLRSQRSPIWMPKKGMVATPSAINVRRATRHATGFCSAPMSTGS